MLSGSSVVKLLGNHVFASGNSTSYLFNTSDASGSVQVGGHYSVIGASSTIPYKTKAGISINGYTSVHDEVLQVITGTASIAPSTTYALIIPAGATTFTVTLPNPTELSHGRKLRVKYTGPTYKTDLTLARFSGTTIDYKSSNITLKWNDSYELGAYTDGTPSSGWLILASHLGAGSSPAATRTILTLHKAYLEAINAEVTGGGDVFRTAEHDNSGAAYFRCVVATTDITENVRVRLYNSTVGAVELDVGQFYLESSSLALVELVSPNLNTLGGSNWPPADGDIFTVTVDGDNGGNTSPKALYSAELVFEP